MRLGMCITGNLHHGGNCGPLCEETKSSNQLTSATQMERLSEYVSILRSHSVEVDLFIYVDPRFYPKKSLTPGTRTYEQSAIDPSDVKVGPDVKRNVTAFWRALNETGLPVVGFELHEERLLCPGWSVCRCARESWPRWWEQALKASRCYQMVERYEARNGFRYDWLGRMRTDLDILSLYPTMKTVNRPHNVYDIARPEEVALLVQTNSHLPLSFHNAVVPPNYGLADWYWLARRDHASPAFRLASDITCQWVWCNADLCDPRFITLHKCGVNEQVLVEWQASRGIMVVSQSLADVSFREGASVNEKLTIVRTKLEDRYREAKSYLLLHNKCKCTKEAPCPNYWPMEAYVAIAVVIGAILIRWMWKLIEAQDSEYNRYSDL
eukprot:3919151-Prymnesium_polylepis.3